MTSRSNYLKKNSFSVMKKLLAIALSLLVSLGAMAQKDTIKEKTKEEKVEVVRDRLIFDIYHSFWMGVPSQGNFMKFDPGFNISAMWDFKLPQSKHISFGLGVGVTYYSQYSNCFMKYDKDLDITKYYLIPSTVKYKHSRMSHINCNIPIEIRYRHSCGFKIDLGVHVGVVAGFAYRYKGPHYNGVEDEYLNYKDRNFYNKEKFSADVFLRMGWKSFGVYCSYQMTNVFKDGKGPKMHPLSVGISISLF